MHKVYTAILERLSGIFDRDILKQIEAAMGEVGMLTPVWHEEYEAYLVESPLYPTVAAEDSPSEALFAYFAYLGNTFEEIAKENYCEIEHKKIKAKTGRWGGAREGAGRPSKPATKAVRLPEPVVYWLKEGDNLARLQAQIEQERHQA